ncbi:MAG: hypothetical protein JSV61_07135 [Anaerolineales bacterium]|nr:MAG: hypothetical protein JSV61_07135 [Anaerolineales bacterium]
MHAATEKARQVKNAYLAELMAKANVVGVGIGYCHRGGVKTDQVGLVVMVSKKVPAHQLDPQDRLPDEIDGVPVDIQEVGELRAQ